MRVRYNVSEIGFGAMYVDAIPRDGHDGGQVTTIEERIRWWETNYPEYTTPK
jgi:hypothetical protein